MLDMLEKTSLCCIRSVLYVLKPAKRADFSMIGRFVNFLTRPREAAGLTCSPTGPEWVENPVFSFDFRPAGFSMTHDSCRRYVAGFREWPDDWYGFCPGSGVGAGVLGSNTINKRGLVIT